MTPKRHLIRRWRNLRDDLDRQVKGLEDGSFRLRKKSGRKWVDATPAAIERTKAQLAEIDRILT
jgi:hypothetical protein